MWRLNWAFVFYQPMDSKSTPLGTRMQQNELLTVQEVAAFLRIGRVTVWRWCRDGTIPACRVGRNWRIPRADFLALLDSSLPLVLVPPCGQTTIATDGHGDAETDESKT